MSLNTGNNILKDEINQDHIKIHAKKHAQLFIDVMYKNKNIIRLQPLYKQRC